MGFRHRWKRWTPERVAAIHAGVAEKKSREEILLEIQAMPGHEGFPVENHHLTGFVRHHFGACGLAQIGPRKRRAPEVLNRPLEPIPWYDRVGSHGLGTRARVIPTGHADGGERDPGCRGARSVCVGEAGGVTRSIQREHIYQAAAGIIAKIEGAEMKAGRIKKMHALRNKVMV